MKRLFLAPLVGAITLAVASPAFAQWNDRRPYGYGSADARRIGYDIGFREGVVEGEKDGRGGDRYRYEDEGDFRRADVGYRSSYGNREQYRQGFRTGFADGYSQGYRRYSRDGRYGRDDRYGNDRYGNGRYGQGSIVERIFGRRDDRSRQRDGYGYRSVAFDNGVRDGIEKGREDIRKNRSFDPRRHEWYRDGDRQYNNRYGSRDQYKVDYRSGFNQGYDEGYRGARYGR